MDSLSKPGLVLCENGNNGRPMRQEPCSLVLSQRERGEVGEGGGERAHCECTSVCMCVCVQERSGGRVSRIMCVCGAGWVQERFYGCMAYALCLCLFCSHGLCMRMSEGVTDRG